VIRSRERPAQVIGLVQDAKYRSVGENPRPFLYAPLAQQFQAELSLLVRRQDETVLPPVRAVVRQLDASLPIVQATTLADSTSFSLFPQRLAASVAGAVGLVSIFLASLGLYGLTAYNLTQRTREIAVRMALGASPTQVVRLVLRQAVALMGSGAVFGVLIGGLATGLLRGLLYGVGPLDPTSFTVATLLLGSVTATAAWFAARRAARVDPLVALRYE
jgi:putative ABC transport system permease protein